MNDAPVRLGDVLAGKYRVERILGAGNMGVVVAATHVGLGQLVALKLMLPGKTAGPEQRERFLREARAAVRLRSQHVARVSDVGVHENGAPYIAMEFLDGQDLAALLHARRQLPFEEATEYVLQTCEAVGEAHAAGIVHRDLKPANLFLTTDVSGSPCIKVLDFGVSKLAGDLTLTNESQALGSPLYMSPEQMNSSRDVDARSDLWSLGIILYQLVAGRTPFHADTIQALCARVFFGQPTPLGEYRSDAPPGFEVVIARCLGRDRERRWHDVAELASALAPYAPAEARVYAHRVSRVLAGKIAPTPSSPELRARTPGTAAYLSPIVPVPVQPTGAVASPPATAAPAPLSTALPPPVQAAEATAPLASATSRATAPSTPGASSNISLGLSTTKNASSSWSQRQRGRWLGLALLGVLGLVMVAVPVAVVVRFGMRGQSAESGTVPLATHQTTVALVSAAELPSTPSASASAPAIEPPLAPSTTAPRASTTVSPQPTSQPPAPTTPSRPKRPRPPKQEDSYVYDDVEKSNAERGATGLYDQKR
ncbi:protein kinase domain-containing protein [Sorangium sp. So ce131]|uniref:serine/threonine-protein kinase n=1 Tax=Sorangium sp. So ce131 TaxID=3133282 RepID=UPI003F5E6C7A